VLVVTATPGAASPAAAAATALPASPSAVSSSSPVPPTPVPTSVPPTATADVFPTDVKVDIQIAYEDFEHGVMFWFMPRKEIWVLFESDSDPKKGTWKIYPDTYQDSEPESDPSLVPPTPSSPDKLFFQPIRGFGKVWRTNPDVKNTLGWATTKELSFTMPYIYQAGGYVTTDNKYVPQPGKHILTTLARETFVLSESDHTWARTN
jgi:hypothetical protein